MCGIIGYVGSRDASRFCCTASSASSTAATTRRDRAPRGRRPDYAARSAISHNLKRSSPGRTARRATTGIGHTRWATHGRVTEENAHPLTAATTRSSRSSSTASSRTTRAARAPARGRATSSRSETDAEVVAHLVEAHYRGDLVEAVRRAYGELEGHFAFVASIATTRPAGRRASSCPLIVGVGEGETFLASSIAAFPRETRRVQLIEDGESSRSRPSGSTFTTRRRRARSTREAIEVDWDDEARREEGLRDVHAQGDLRAAEAVAETIGDRDPRGAPRPRGPRMADGAAGAAPALILACGTRYHAGLVGALCDRGVGAVSPASSTSRASGATATRCSTRTRS